MQNHLQFNQTPRQIKENLKQFTIKREFNLVQLHKTRTTNKAQPHQGRAIKYRNAICYEVISADLLFDVRNAF
jgi:hypothetical protein